MTQECIDSVYDKTEGVEFEVILVDNASTDGSRIIFEQDTRIKYIYSSENVGFGRANNLGYRYALGKYIFLLNSDTILMNNAIKIFFDYMENAMNNIACCGCFLRNSKNEIIHSYGRFHTFWNSITEWCFQPYLHHFGVDLHKYDYPIKMTSYCEVDFITGADVFLRKEVADKYGLFDPDFFMYYEDAEMAKRFNEHNYKSVLIDAPQIVHLVGSSYKKSNHSKQIMVMKSMFIYEKKYMSKIEYAIFKRIFKFLYCLSVVGRKGSFVMKFQHIKS